MFSSSHASAYRNVAFSPRADFQMRREQRAELYRPGSLSKRLQRWCAGALPVTVLRQGRCMPTRDEARLLGLRPREQVWAREVWLGPAETPWIRGRTVTPLREMKGQVQALRNLGTKPLGSVLFTGPAWRRSPFLVGHLRPAAGAPALPARRSVFYYGRSRLLVTEGFCEAYWQQAKAECPPCANASAVRPATACSTPTEQKLASNYV